MKSKSYSIRQKQLVHYIAASGTFDKKILTAIKTTPRHEFVPRAYRKWAYEDKALSIGVGQTISQPSLVALMTQLLRLKGTENVLEIGTGSGYQAAILTHLADTVHTVERIPSLAKRAKKRLQRLGYANARVHIANGTLGLPKYAPYDAIIVTAGARDIPKPLVEQLKQGGRIVIPTGITQQGQQLTVGVKRKNKLSVKKTEFVRFVPLIGKHGWK